jgi:hypothetical protein
LLNPIDDATAVLRERLQDFIGVADDEKSKAINTLVKEKIALKDQWSQNEEFATGQLNILPDDRKQELNRAF